MSEQDRERLGSHFTEEPPGRVFSQIPGRGFASSARFTAGGAPRPEIGEDALRDVISLTDAPSAAQYRCLVGESWKNRCHCLIAASNRHLVRMRSAIEASAVRLASTSSVIHESQQLLARLRAPRATATSRRS